MCEYYKSMHFPVIWQAQGAGLELVCGSINLRTIRRRKEYPLVVRAHSCTVHPGHPKFQPPHPLAKLVLGHRSIVSQRKPHLEKSAPP